MKQFPLVFKHYFKRMMTNKVALFVQLGLPIILIIVNLAIAAADTDADVMQNGYNMMHTTIVILMLFSFAFFGGAWLVDYLFPDLTEARKFRLFFVPIDKRIYALAAMLASMIVSFLQSLLIIVLTTVALNIHWGDVGILAALVVVTILLSHFVHYFLYLVAKNKGQANALSNLITFGLAALGGLFFGNPGDLVDLPILNWFHDYGTPLSQARRSMHYAGFVGDDMGIAIQSLLILLSATALFICLTFIIGKVKKA
ncbi:MAG: ABC transporter permease [Defluviitaleaceae bacterium]|nr:ABC transporter permease [Defluviitaleaceae bacterium]